MNILDKLTSLPHNEHFINRYYDFILDCQEANQSLSVDDYVELHHILPKADDMFPEYKDLSEHTWNGVYLTARQHIVAHVMLWKAYPSKASQCAAVHYFLSVQNSDLVGKSLRKIPTSIKIRYAAKAREEFYRSRIGYGIWSDASGETFFLHKDDAKIQELGLVGVRTGKKHTDVTRERMSASKQRNLRVTLYFLDCKIRVRLNQPEFHEYVEQGWTTSRIPDDYEYIDSLRYQKISKKSKGKIDYMYPDGTYYGKLLKTDPLIEQLGLVFHLTEGRLNSIDIAQKIASEKNIGTQWYNDGKENKRFHTNPGFPWVPGVLYVNDEETKNKRRDGLRKVRVGKVCYNDGVRNYYIYPTDAPLENWVAGMAPRKPKHQ